MLTYPLSYKTQSIFSKKIDLIFVLSEIELTNLLFASDKLTEDKVQQKRKRFQHNKNDFG